MTTFDEREKDFEARFKHDQEFRFKVTARRNHLLGLWAAERLGLLNDAAEQYAKEIVAAQFERGGDAHILDKLAADLGAKDLSVTRERVRFELDRLAEAAKEQLMQE
jgi:hypothetical protein